MSNPDHSMPQGGDVDVAANLERVRDRLAAALNDAQRKPDAATLIAVSKKHSAATIQKAIVAGHRVFGENRVQEAQAKWPDLCADTAGIVLHLIGPLQSNKAADAVAVFDVIETIDRPKIARAVASEISKQGRSVRCLVQVNTGEEPQKAGIAPDDAATFLAACSEEYGLAVDGLMCIPPIDEPPAPHFALLAKLADCHHLPVVSMGMSADFDIAARLGATHVRVGSEIFGPRPTS
jgi:hypothetical protein